LFLFQEKKRNIKPLKAQNGSLNASLFVKKVGVKPLSRSKSELSSRVKKPQSVSRAFKTTLNTEKSKLKQMFSISSEQFTTVKGNRLPPCSVPPTPTRRETYLVIQEAAEVNKENTELKQLKQRTKSANDICEPVNLRVGQFKKFEYPPSVQTVSPVLATPPRQKMFRLLDENAELGFNTATYNSHPHKGSLCTIGRKRIEKETSKDSSPDRNRNFLDVLNCLSFTPTPSRSNQGRQEVAFDLHYFSPEDGLLPPCNVSPTPDRRQTYAIPPGSKLENESHVQLSEEIVFTTRKVKHVYPTCSMIPRMRIESDEFNDSLEDQDDVFKKILVAESGAQQWSEWQKRNLSRSEDSSEGSVGKQCESVYKTPRSKVCSTGLTPQFDKLNFISQNSVSFHPGSPVDFTLLPPAEEDTCRCSTVMKKLEHMSYDSTCSTICKELFSSDLVECVANDSISLAELSHLSSGTFVKSGSSFTDINFQYPDISCQESVIQQNSYRLNQDGKKTQVSLSQEENTARSVIEAGLWVEQSSRGKLLAETAVDASIRTVDTIAKERKFMNSFSPKEHKSEEHTEKIFVVPVKQLKNSEGNESGGIFLEISPPRGQVYDICGSTMETDSVQKQKPSRITGWSKTSIKSRNRSLSNMAQGKN
jgi:hypothetical protein